MQPMKWILQYLCEHPDEFVESRNEIIYTLINYLTDLDPDLPATFYLLMHTLREALLVDKDQCHFEALPSLIDNLYEVEEKRMNYVCMVRKKKLRCECLKEDSNALEKRVEHIIVALKREIMLQEIQKTPFNATKCIAALQFLFPLSPNDGIGGPLHPRPNYLKPLKYTDSPRTVLHELIIEAEEATKDEADKRRKRRSSTRTRSPSPSPARADCLDPLAKCEALQRQKEQIGWQSIRKSLASYLDTVDRHVKEMEAALFPLKQEYKNMGISEGECVLDRILKYDLHTSAPPSPISPISPPSPVDTHDPDYHSMAPLTTWPIPLFPNDTMRKRRGAPDSEVGDGCDSISSFVSPRTKRSKPESVEDAEELTQLTQLTHVSATPPPAIKKVRA